MEPLGHMMNPVIASCGGVVRALVKLDLTNICIFNYSFLYSLFYISTPQVQMTSVKV